MIIVLKVESIEVCSFANCENCKRASLTPFCGYCGIRCMPLVLQGYKFFTDSKNLFVGLELQEGCYYPKDAMITLEYKLNNHSGSKFPRLPMIFSNGILKELTLDEVLQIF